jgi:hypothetical protein
MGKNGLQLVCVAPCASGGQTNDLSRVDACLRDTVNCPTRLMADADAGIRVDQSTQLGNIIERLQEGHGRETLKNSSEPPQPKPTLDRKVGPFDRCKPINELLFGWVRKRAPLKESVKSVR